MGVNCHSGSAGTGEKADMAVIGSAGAWSVLHAETYQNLGNTAKHNALIFLFNTFFVIASRRLKGHPSSEAWADISQQVRPFVWTRTTHHDGIIVIIGVYLLSN